MKSYTLHYSEALARKVVRSFWWRTTGGRFVGALAVVFLALVYSIGSGDRSWRVGLMGAMFGLGLTFSVAIYVVHYRNTVTKARRMRTPEAAFEIGDGRFRLTSDLGSSEFPWSTITEIWQFPTFWLLFFAPSQFMTLPLADLDDEARDLILTRAKAHGTKVS